MGTEISQGFNFGLGLLLAAGLVCFVVVLGLFLLWKIGQWAERKQAEKELAQRNAGLRDLQDRDGLH